MSALLVSQKDIFAELRLIDAGRQNIADKRTWLANERAKQQAIEQELWIAEKELAEKDRELRERLQNLIIDGELPPVTLVFDENTFTTRWDGGSVKLSEIPFKFLKALHDAPDRQLSWNDIEGKVWGESKDGAIHTTASRLRTALKKHKCPLRLVSLNRKTWIPDEEYQEDQNRPSPTMKTTTGFRLE